MNDLKNGIIRFDEMVVTSQTSKQEFRACLSGLISPISSENLFYLTKTLTIEGVRWGVVFTFDGEKISRIQLIPSIKYKSEDWDRTGQQEERRQFCDRWLYERLGEPQENNGGASYDFANIRIACVTHFDTRNGADAGYIFMSYK